MVTSGFAETGLVLVTGAGRPAIGRGHRRPRSGPGGGAKGRRTDRPTPAGGPPATVGESPRVRRPRTRGRRWILAEPGRHSGPPWRGGRNRWRASTAGRQRRRGDPRGTPRRQNPASPAFARHSRSRATAATNSWDRAWRATSTRAGRHARHARHGGEAGSPSCPPRRETGGHPREAGVRRRARRGWAGPGTPAWALRAGGPDGILRHIVHAA